MTPTTVCILTPPGEGGIGVIEVRGPGAAEMVNGFFRSPRGLCVADASPGQLLYGKLLHDGEVLDEVIVACVKTGEQGVLEVNCHGGAVASSRVVDALLLAGARVTTAGERIALMRESGILDAITAEAVAWIPRAPTLLAASVLLDQYRGALAREVKEIVCRVGEPADPDEIAGALESLLATARYGRGLIEPCRVVVTGRPNVGKSTLSNALLRFERMIVHAIPGTTRDTVEDLFSVAGIPFVLVDTAGIRETTDEIEREGVERARAAALDADATVLVIDGSEPLAEEDRVLLQHPSVRPRVIALNKSDLPLRAELNKIVFPNDRPPVSVSAMKGEGIEELERRILDAAYPARPGAGAAVVFTARQEECLKESLAAAKAADADGVSHALDSLLRPGD